MFLIEDEKAQLNHPAACLDCFIDSISNVKSLMPHFLSISNLRGPEFLVILIKSLCTIKAESTPMSILCRTQVIE